ncbi:hypothetical protein GCM10010278_62050 [Streptomyces melanogenes]|nr:hypothetical protein GCM10010278_62050 [Streptomyces melanogenes]
MAARAIPVAPRAARSPASRTVTVPSTVLRLPRLRQAVVRGERLRVICISFVVAVAGAPGVCCWPPWDWKR